MSAVADPPVTLTVSDEGVAFVAMGDVDGRNALSETFVNALSDAFEQAGTNPASRVIVMSGTADIFCSGASKELLLQMTSGGIAPGDLYLPSIILGAPLPVIAAMEGHAVGGGFALGLCADIVVLARESRYGCNFMNLGITPGMGTTRLLEHAISPALAQELLLTGELRRGSRFVGNAGFNYILPKVDVGPKAMDLALRIAEKPRHALEVLKKTIAARRLAIFEGALLEEARMHRSVLSDPATRQRIEAEFVE